MTEQLSDQCQDPTQTLTIELPCQIVERVERYAKKNKTSVAGVLIEALDQFLRNPEKAWQVLVKNEYLPGIGLNVKRIYR